MFRVNALIRSNRLYIHFQPAQEQHFEPLWCVLLFAEWVSRSISGFTLITFKQKTMICLEEFQHVMQLSWPYLIMTLNYSILHFFDNFDPQMFLNNHWETFQPWRHIWGSKSIKISTSFDPSMCLIWETFWGFICMFVSFWTLKNTLVLHNCTTKVSNLHANIL